jgi:prephenate dehydrogenase
LRRLKQITIIGTGLLGGSIALAVSRCFPGIKTVGYSHRPATRRKARQLAVADEIVDDICRAVSCAELVIVASPVCTFEGIFSRIAPALPAGCIVTDVGSTKVLPHRWAAKILQSSVRYVGSHPIAGSEQRGVEFARDDLFDRALCILTTTQKTDRMAVRTLKNFWSRLGCTVKLMNPAVHDRVFADISHLPHIVAASLINANTSETLKYAGKGFIDASRIASGPANIWADILVTNAENSVRSIDKITAELSKMRKAIKAGDKKRIEKLLSRARLKRARLMEYKIKAKEILS